MTDVIVDAIAVFRLTRLVRKDTITAPARARLRACDRCRMLDELVECPWCVSWWIALGVVTARRRAPRVWDPVARALAFSAVAGLVSANLD